MPPNGFHIDRSQVERMTRELQREFDKHPVHVPVKSAGSAVPAHSSHYYGPVVQVHGDRTQVAWGAGNIRQVQESAPLDVAAGYEQLANATAKILQSLGGVPLADEDREVAEVAGREVLEELVRQEPDRRALRRAVAALKGALTPIALGLSAGAVDGVQEWAHTAVTQLTAAL